MSIRARGRGPGVPTSQKLLAAAALLSLALSSSVLATSTPDSRSEAIRAELQALCQRVLASDDPFFGNRNFEELQRRLARPASDPRTRLEELGRYAFELVRLGRHQEAIERLEEAIELYRHSVTAAPALETFLLSLLGVAHFQLAEDENCIALGTEASCILPIRERAVHRERDHSVAAGDLFAKLAARNPNDLASRWLLNLSRMVSGDYPAGVPEELRLPSSVLSPDFDPERTPPYVNVAARLGVDAHDTAGGAIMDDFDGDGRLDLVSSSWDPCAPLKAFRNTGSGFEDVAAEWKLDSQLGGLNLVHADYDNDGDLDILILRGAWSGRGGRIRNSLLRNDLAEDGAGFVDVTAAAGLAYPAFPTQSAAWSDYDLDGDLDLFVANEGPQASVDPLALKSQVDRDYPSQLFRNNGDGSFRDVARSAGIVERTFAKGAAWGDYDDDGYPDLYVSNLGPNLLYRNNRDGSFNEVAEELGITGGSVRTFATWFFDFDNDGDLDLFAAAYHLPADVVAASSYLGLRVTGSGFRGGNDVALDSRPLLFEKTGGRFVESGLDLGFDKSLLPMGANYGDLDGDGWLDLYLGTGMPDFSALHPNVHYRNLGGRFADLTFDSGLGHLQKGHGIAFGDLDNDGRLDLFQQLGGAFPYDAYGNALYLNPDDRHRFLVLRFSGRQANRLAFGARVEVRARRGSERRSLFRVVGTGGSFGSSSVQLEVGLGNAEEVESVVVRWPRKNQEPQTLSSFELDRHYLVVEGERAPRPLAVSPLHFELRARPASASHSEHDDQGRTAPPAPP